MNEVALKYDDVLDKVEQTMHEIGEKQFELSDFFCGGMYIRCIIAEPGDQLVSKVHKVEHPYFLMSGTIEIISQEGKQTVSAPFINITPAGTRRYARCLTHVLFCTVHRTDKETVQEVEEEVIIKRENPLLAMKGIVE